MFGFKQLFNQKIIVIIRKRKKKNKPLCESDAPWKVQLRCPIPLHHREGDTQGPPGAGTAGVGDTMGTWWPGGCGGHMYMG